MHKIITIFVILFLAGELVSQKDLGKDGRSDELEELIKGLKFRSIGPAFTSGRIADFAVNDKNPKEYFVGVASGGIWKTTNAGNTYEPVFDSYGAYAIGSLAMDPGNHNVVWAGTGENNHQRALGYGDGVYVTRDGGKNWENMGLEESRQIGKILIHPRETDIVYVAAEGSAWGPGGDRGLYKTTDGGKNWKRILYISENTGINDMVMDPENPDVIYASSEQRRRHVHTKIGGGPETGIFKTMDGGETWDTLKSGLPKGHMGGIGLAVSPVNPDVVYAIIEAALDEGGFYRSTDRGASWEKMSDHVSSGQYYNEIYCDPSDVDKVYSVETYSHVTKDGGKTWKRLSNKGRHVDDHAMWIDPQDTDHFLIGGDGGVYETWDGGENYHHKSNLPVTQFYRVTVDNSEPFYWVYGGTQDNFTLGGPSRNINEKGVSSGEWKTVIGGDGFWTRVDPENPNIVYAEYQYGNVFRYDKQSGEALYIKPLPGKNELTYKWNWNTPLIISHHQNKRLYMAANKVFRSDDRGNSWDVISDDLTTKTDRNKWPVMGKYWSAEAVVKDVSTSLYGTIVSMDESPVKEFLLYVGTDDGVIQVKEEDKGEWRLVNDFPGVPEYTYVSDIFASRFDENVVYASFDNRKRDDFKPYLLKSEDKGRSWTSIAEGLPENCPVHTIQQDFINPGLLFIGTEYGVYFTNDGGQNWMAMKSGLPTISVKEIAIQEREHDLVLATFGRGFYILDDYSPLRSMENDMLDKEAHLFDVRDSRIYIEEDVRYGQGATYYIADNPPFGATITFYLKEKIKTSAEKRREKEQKLFEESKPIPDPGWKALHDEKLEEKPYLLLTVYDNKNDVIRKITAKPEKGIHRVHWNLRYPSTEPLDWSTKETEFDPFKKTEDGMLVMPGKYKVDLQKCVKGKFSQLAGPVEFNVVSLKNKSIPVENKQELENFQHDIAELARRMYGASELTNQLLAKVKHIKQTILAAAGPTNLLEQAELLETRLEELQFKLHGLQPKASWEEIPPAEMPLMYRLESVIYAHIRSTAIPTKTQRVSYKLLNEEILPLYDQLNKIANEDIKKLEDHLNEQKFPWTKGRIL